MSYIKVLRYLEVVLVAAAIPALIVSLLLPTYSLLPVLGVLLVLTVLFRIWHDLTPKLRNDLLNMFFYATFVLSSYSAFIEPDVYRATRPFWAAISVLLVVIALIGFGYAFIRYRRNKSVSKESQS